MSKEPVTRDITVELVPTPNGEDPVSYKINESDLVFRNDGHPGFVVNFNLSDPHNTGYLFPDSKTEAMWVHKIIVGDPDPCPKTAVHWPEFQAQKVLNGNTTLEVRNLNEHKHLFAFALRVTQTPHDPQPVLVPLDPIGDNQNGSTSANSMARAVVTLLVVGAVALIGYKLLLR